MAFFLGGEVPWKEGRLLFFGGEVLWKGRKVGI